MSIRKKLKWFYMVTLRHAILAARSEYLRRIYGMNIGEGVLMSLKVNLDKTHPKGIHIGDGTYIAFNCTILTHDMCRNKSTDVIIGRNCFIGAGALIMPGVSLGDSVVVGAGSVVTRSFPGGVVIAGNPAKIIKEGIVTRPLGILVQQDED